MQRIFIIFLFFTSISDAYTQSEFQYTPKEFHLFNYETVSNSFGRIQFVDTTFFENGSISSISKYHSSQCDFNLDINQVYKTVFYFNRCGEIYLKSEYLRSGNPNMLGILGYQFSRNDTPLKVSPCPITALNVK